MNSKYFKIHDKLNVNFWRQKSLDPDVRRALLRIANEFVVFLDIPVNVFDVIFTGSLASYNFSKYSDVDLHIVVNFEDLGENKDLISKFLLAKGQIWNNSHEIFVKGHQVEVYVQDVNEPHYSLGIYSIVKGEWLKVPSKIKPQISDEEVLKKYFTMKNKIQTAIQEKNLVSIESIKKKIKNMRKSGLDKEGIFSIENLVFKLLRRSGMLRRLRDASIELRDASLSLENVE